MKKSQTLAALALAFALGLGVVAPAANTYAKYASDYTAEQTAEMNNLVSYANVLVSSTKNLSSYIAVYDAIETKDTGARAQLTEAVKEALNAYNDGPAKSASPLNTLIQAAILRTSLGFDAENLKSGADAEQASPVALAQLGSASDLKTAYNALKTLVANVQKNYEVLDKNYENKGTSTAVTDLEGAYDNILSSANYWIAQIETEVKNTVTASAASTLTALEAIDKEGYDALIASDAWKNAANNANTQLATRWGLLVDFAESLPKYNLVSAVKTTKVNFDKLASTNNTVVDYAQAKSYADAYINAVMAFRGEATDPTNPSATLRTLTSGDVTVVAYLDADVVLEVKDATTSAFGDKAHKAYDIVLKKTSDANWKFSGSAVVTIKTGALDASKTSAYYLSGNNAEGLSTIRGEGVVSFTATHFSVYAIVQDGQSQAGGIGGAEDPSAPGTGVLSSADGNAATTVSIVAGLATALTALGAGVVAYRSARRSNK